MSAKWGWLLQRERCVAIGSFHSGPLEPPCPYSSEEGSQGRESPGIIGNMALIFDKWCIKSEFSS